MTKRTGSEVARLVPVSTILFAIHKAQQGKYSIRGLKMSKKAAKEPQVGYVVLEKFDLFLVSVLVSVLVPKRKRPKTLNLWPTILMVGDTRFELVTPSV